MNNMENEVDYKIYVNSCRKVSTEEADTVHVSIYNDEMGRVANQFAIRVNEIINKEILKNLENDELETLQQNIVDEIERRKDV